MSTEAKVNEGASQEPTTIASALAGTGLICPEAVEYAVPLPSWFTMPEGWEVRLTEDERTLFSEPRKGYAVTVKRLPNGRARSCWLGHLCDSDLKAHAMSDGEAKRRSIRALLWWASRYPLTAPAIESEEAVTPLSRAVSSSL